MPVDLLGDLDQINLDQGLAIMLDVRPPLRLARSWPRSAEHLLLEYQDAEGRILPGQWLAGANSLALARAGTAAAVQAQGMPSRSTIVRAGACSILLQP